MSVTPHQLSQKIEAELAKIGDGRIAAHVRSLLVDPYAVSRAWDYGEADDAYPCWSVLEHKTSNSAIAFCEHGFGPEKPWGLVTLYGDSDMSMGMDSGWFTTFIEAFLESSAGTEVPIWRVFKQEGLAYPGLPVSAEGEWAQIWNEVEKLRAADPGSRYHCSHSIPLWWHET